MPVPSIQEIKSEFAATIDWEDKYQYLIYLGKLLEGDDKIKQPSNLVKGCTSRVWIHLQTKPKLEIQAISDSLLVAGLIVILIAYYQDETNQDYSKYPVIFKDLEINKYISIQRQKGLQSIINSIQHYAENQV